MDMFDILAAALVVILGAIAAYRDIAARTIPNWLCLVTGLAGLLAAAYPFDLFGWSLHLAHLAVALAIGMGLFAVGWWGGGDAKFFAAAAAWFPISAFFQLLLWTSAAGLLLVLGVFAARGGKLRRRGTESKGLPYGVAIAAGMIVTFAAEKMSA